MSEPPKSRTHTAHLDQVLEEMWRDIMRANLGLEGILAHLGLEDVSEEEMDAPWTRA